MKKRGKKGVSPIVSTSLLIVIVIILAIIIFLWARGFIGEVIEKTIHGVTKTAEKFCGEVEFVATISPEDGVDKLFIVNNGDVPIYEVNVKRYSKGKSTIQNYTVETNAGMTSDGIDLDAVKIDGTEEKIVVIPVLKGKTKSDLKKYTCPESTGYEL